MAAEGISRKLVVEAPGRVLGSTPSSETRRRAGFYTGGAGAGAGLSEAVDLARLGRHPRRGPRLSLGISLAVIGEAKLKALQMLAEAAAVAFDTFAPPLAPSGGRRSGHAAARRYLLTPPTWRRSRRLGAGDGEAAAERLRGGAAREDHDHVYAGGEVAVLPAEPGTRRGHHGRGATTSTPATWPRGLQAHVEEAVQGPALAAVVAPGAIIRPRCPPGQRRP
jgi:hypothetical protein